MNRTTPLSHQDKFLIEYFRIATSHRSRAMLDAKRRVLLGELDGRGIEGEVQGGQFRAEPRFLLGLVGVL